MPKQLLNMPSFEGGLNNLLDPRDISLPELSFAQNVMCDKNGIIRNVGIAVRRNIGALDGITDIRAGYGLYVFESSFGIGSVGSVTAGAYAATCKFEHDSEVHTDEDVWYVMISGNDGMHAHTARSGWLSLNETLSSTENVTFDFVDTKAVYHIADEGLRICNADYDHDFSKTSKSRWFGFIQKKNYFAGADNTKDYYFNGWYFLDNDIKAPTHFKVTTDAFSAQADYSPSSTTGEGFNLHLNATAGGNHDFSLAQDSDGAVIYEFASSFIYDGIQESLLHEDAGAGGKFITLLTVSGNNPDVSAMNSLQMSVKVNSGYNPRVTGGRIYFRPYQTNEEWVLLVDIDFEKGCRASLNDVYPNTPWTVIAETGESTQIAFESATGMTNDLPTYPSAINSTFLNIESYYTLNEWSPSEPRISIGCNNLNDNGVWDNVGNGYPSNTGEGYKCSAIINRRCFIANTALYKNESSAVASGSLFRERDRIYYSAMNKFDCFPRTTHYIDVVRGDAEEYTVLIGYADRLLAFKTYTLYIINIGAQDPREWFLESQHKGMGLKKQCQVTQTSDGVVWANSNGAYSYTGGEVRTTTTEDISFGADIATLTKGKINEHNWLNNDNDISVTYIYKKKQLIVAGFIESHQALGGYIYDFITGTWTVFTSGTIFKFSNSSATNFVTDYLGDIFYGTRADENAQYVNNPTFALLGGWTHGLDDGEGNVSGYTLTKVSSYAPSAYISTSGAGQTQIGQLIIDQPRHPDDIGTACYFEYTTLENLDAGKTYKVSFPFLAASLLQIQVWYKAAGAGDETYTMLGDIHETNFPQWNTFDESFITSVEDNYTIKVGMGVQPEQYIHVQIAFFSIMPEVEFPNQMSLYRFDTENSVTGTLNGDRFNLPEDSIIISTKDIDFGQPGLKKKVYAIYITHRTPSSSSTQTTPVSYATNGGTSFTNLTGNITATGGAWSVSKFYSATPIECQSIRFKVTNSSADGMLEINDMAIEYRQINKKVA